MKMTPRLFVAVTLGFSFGVVGEVRGQACVANPTLGEQSFSIPNTSQANFQPSAVVVMVAERPCRALVFSDASERLEFAEFEFTNTGLENVGTVVSFDAYPLFKIEAATTLFGTDDYIVVTAGSRTDQPPDRNDRALHLSRLGDRWLVVDLSQSYHLFLDALREELRRRSGYVQPMWLKVEALAALDGEAFLVGVRQSGPHYKLFDNMVLVAVWRPADLSTGNIQIAFEQRFLTQRGGRTFGISSMECELIAGEPATRCYVLISSEVEIKIETETVTEHRAKLYEIQLEALRPGNPMFANVSPNPSQCWDYKGEGLSFLPNNQMLVVFDSDRDEFEDKYWIGAVPQAGANVNC